jgi:hypothetical protein
MSTFTQFHNWALGDTLSPAFLNGEIASIVTAGNNIDNNNIGTLGVYASQVKPTSGAQATFGGTQLYTMNNGLSVLSGADAVVPAAITGNSVTQSAALLQVAQSLGGTLEFQIAANGTGTINGPFILLNSGNLNAAASAAIQANGAGDSIFLNVPTTSALGVQYRVNNVLFGGFNTTGVLSAAPLINALNTVAPVAPCYTAAGVAVAGTLHCVLGSTAINGNTTATINLTNAAVFTSVTSYAVFAAASTNNGGAGENPPFIGNFSATAFILGNPTVRNLTYNWVAIGI